MILYTRQKLQPLLTEKFLIETHFRRRKYSIININVGAWIIPRWPERNQFFFFLEFVSGLFFTTGIKFMSAFYYRIMLSKEFRGLISSRTGFRWFWCLANNGNAWPIRLTSSIQLHKYNNIMAHINIL